MVRRALGHLPIAAAALLAASCDSAARGSGDAGAAGSSTPAGTSATASTDSFAGFAPLGSGFYRGPDGGLFIETRGINADGTGTHAFLRAVPDIDLPSYRRLPGDYYSRDAQRVYVEHVMSDGLHLWLLEGAEAASFQVIGYRWGKDRARVYHGSLVLEGASAAELEVVPEQDGRFFDYVRDGDEVFFRSERLEGADPRSFALWPGGDGGAVDPYGRDAAHVYFEEDRVEGAAPDTFELLGRGYARDATAVYHGARRLEGAERKTFEVVAGEAHHARDAHWLYRWDMRVGPRP